jgi:hypothetical protein
MNNHNPEPPSQKLSLGRAFRRGFFPTKVFFSATTLLDLVVLLTHVGGLTGGDSWCQLNIWVDGELSGPAAPGKDCCLPLRPVSGEFRLLVREGVPLPFPLRANPGSDL